MKGTAERLSDRLNESNTAQKSRAVAAAFQWKRWDVEFKIQQHKKWRFSDIWKQFWQGTVSFLFVSLQVWLKEDETFQPLGTWDGVNLVFLSLWCVNCVCVFVCVEENALSFTTCRSARSKIVLSYLPSVSWPKMVCAIVFVWTDTP